MAAEVYLDYASSTPLDPRVRVAMEPFLADCFANPGSAHAAGQQAAAAVELARGEVADFLGVSPSEVTFTSGATESCNLAVLGVVRRAMRREGRAHVVTTAVEHPAVSEPVKQLVAEGARATVVAASRQTLVNASDVLRAIEDDTVLVAMAYVCSETGSVQPLGEVGQQLATLNDRRRASGLSRVLLFTDATQAAPWLPCGVPELGVDLLALSGHKIYGPKGAGALYVAPSVDLEPLLYGGSQELGRRPGTTNVPAAVGLGAAVKLLRGPRHAREVARVRRLRSQLAAALSRLGARLTVPSAQAAPGHVHVSVAGLPSEALLTALDLAGVAASAGFACQSGARLPSAVLLGSGWSAVQAVRAIRFSLGRYTTAHDVRRGVEAWRTAVGRLRATGAELARSRSGRVGSRTRRRLSRGRG